MSVIRKVIRFKICSPNPGKRYTPGDPPYFTYPYMPPGWSPVNWEIHNSSYSGVWSSPGMVDYRPMVGRERKGEFTLHAAGWMSDPTTGKRTGPHVGFVDSAVIKSGKTSSCSYKNIT